MSARQSAIDVFEKRGADFAAITTFGFDPVYFERRLLRTKALDGASRILVFMDATEWCKLLERREPARHLNNRYLVVPVAMGSGVFHPKVVLLLGSDGVTVACNSANLTRAGYSHNLELLNAGHSTFDKPEAAVIKVAETILHLLKDACTRSWSRAPGQIATEWLEMLTPLPAVGTGSEDDIALWTTQEPSLWERICGLWQARPPHEVWVISPFFDKDNGLLRRLQATAPRASVNFVVQDGTSVLDATAAKALAPKLSLFDLNSDGRRRLHAKAMVWRSGGCWSMVVGSANWTRAAFDGANAEAVLYLPDCGDWQDRLFGDGLSLDAISPTEFESGLFVAPEEEACETASRLRVRSAELVQRQFNLEVEWPRGVTVEEAALDIWVGHDIDPRASVPVHVKGSGGTARAPDALDVGSGLRVGLRVTTTTDVLVSPTVWVVRRDQLEREIGSGGTSSRQRQIRDTGEGLEAFLDELASVSGPSAVVEYLRSLSLRYDDGSGGGGGAGGVFRIKVHDPFRGDGIPEWWMNLGERSEDLRAALVDFVDRHEKQRLLKHARQGNINGLENFLDIMSCLVRLLYRYHRRDQRVIHRGTIISRFCAFAEIATGGTEVKGVTGPGYLRSLVTNLRSDKARLVARCREREFAECVRATLWLAQIARAKNEEPRIADPRDMLRAWVTRLNAALNGAGLETIDDAGLVRGLRRLGLNDPEVAEASPKEFGLTSH